MVRARCRRASNGTMRILGTAARTRDDAPFEPRGGPGLRPRGSSQTSGGGGSATGRTTRRATSAGPRVRPRRPAGGPASPGSTWEQDTTAAADRTTIAAPSGPSSRPAPQTAPRRCPSSPTAAQHVRAKLGTGDPCCTCSTVRRRQHGRRRPSDLVGIFGFGERIQKGTELTGARRADRRGALRRTARVRAIRWQAAGTCGWRSVPGPGDPGPCECAPGVRLCGVCGTDLEEYRHGPITIPARTPHPLSGRRRPDHGARSGRRGRSPGSGSRRPDGDRVVPDGLFTCGDCDRCRGGARLHCVRRPSSGCTPTAGCAEYLTVPAAMCVPVPGSSRTGWPCWASRSPWPSGRYGGPGWRRPAEPNGWWSSGPERSASASRDRPRGDPRGVRPRSRTGADDRDPASRRDSARRRSSARPMHPWTGTTDCVIDCAGSESSFTDRDAPRYVPVAGWSSSAPPYGRRISPRTRCWYVRSPCSRSFSHDLAEDTREAVRLLSEGTLLLDHVVTDTVALTDAVDRVFADPPATAAGIKTVIDPSAPDGSAATGLPAPRGPWHERSRDEPGRTPGLRPGRDHTHRQHPVHRRPRRSTILPSSVWWSGRSTTASSAASCRRSRARSAS